MKTGKIQLWAGILIAIGIKLIFFAKNPPFWDSVLLCSDVPRAYFNSWPSIFLPESYAVYPRYPPGLGYYIAAWWKITGTSLFTLNISFLPFIIGIVYQLYLLSKKFQIAEFFLPLLLLISIEPTLSSQIYLINTDTLILFFFLLGMNAILEEKKFLLLLACSALVLVSPRGMVYIAGLFISEAVLFLQKGGIKQQWRLYLKFLLPYISALLVQAIWLMAFQHHYGWSVFNGSIGEYSFGTGGGFKEKLKSIPKNIALIGWRMVDFGRIFTFILIGYLFRKYFNVLGTDQKAQLLKLGVFISGFFLVATAAFCLISLPIGHRYLLPGIFLLYIFVVCIIRTLKPFIRLLSFSLLFLFQLVGNNIVYPRGIAVGWDATLAHIPYHSLRTEVMNEMKKKKIPFSSTGSWFPNLSSFDNVDFNESREQFKAAQLASDEYVFYSNIFNDVSDEELHELFRSGKWAPVYSRKKGLVEVILFKKSH